MQSLITHMTSHFGGGLSNKYFTWLRRFSVLFLLAAIGLIFGLQNEFKKSPSTISTFYNSVAMVESSVKGLYLQSSNFDLGVVTPGQPAHASFTLLNKNVTPIVIASVKGSCSCTDVHITANKVLPNSTAAVDAVLDTYAIRESPFVRQILVSIEGGQHILLAIHGKLQDSQLVSVFPSRISFENLSEGKVEIKSLFLKGDSGVLKKIPSEIDVEPSKNYRLELPGKNITNESVIKEIHVRSNLSNHSEYKPENASLSLIINGNENSIISVPIIFHPSLAIWSDPKEVLITSLRTKIRLHVNENSINPNDVSLTTDLPISLSVVKGENSGELIVRAEPIETKLKDGVSKGSISVLNKKMHPSNLVIPTVVCK